MNIFSADMLRSGSWHIQAGLSALLGWREEILLPLGSGHQEQNVDAIKTNLLAPKGEYIFGGHHVAYPETVGMMQAFGMKPMITVRNIYDTVVSIREKLDKGDVMPGLWVPQTWQSWDEEQKYEWLANNAVPFQLKLFCSWWQYPGEKLWNRYHEFYANQKEGFHRILRYYQIEPRHPELMQEVTTRQNINFNVGIAGRGEKLPRDIRDIIDSQIYSWGKELGRAIRDNLS